jgi:hypothetical protein
MPSVHAEEICGFEDSKSSFMTITREEWRGIANGKLLMPWNLREQMISFDFVGSRRSIFLNFPKIGK